MESQAWLEAAKAIDKATHQWQVVGEILFTSQSKDDAVERLAAALDISPEGAEAVLEQPLIQLLPERRRLHNYRIRQRAGVITLPHDSALKD